MNAASVIDSRYELQALRHRGSTAEVWEARDRRLQRLVAIKLLYPEGAVEDYRDVFTREARTADRFAHPNTVSVMDAGSDCHMLYLVMELVEGPTLADLLEQEGPLEPREATSIAYQILAALTTGHRAGYVHCDVKPSNILLHDVPPTYGFVPSATRWLAKLGDFGASRKSGERVPVGSHIQITPRYTSPEQAAGKPAVPASDIYSLGVVLFEMLCGRLPFVRETPMESVDAHRHETPPSLLSIRPDLPRPLVDLTARALRKNPAERLTSSAMRNEIAAFDGLEPMVG